MIKHGREYCLVCGQTEQYFIYLLIYTIDLFYALTLIELRSNFNRRAIVNVFNYGIKLFNHIILCNTNIMFITLKMSSHIYDIIKNQQTIFK